MGYCDLCNVDLVGGRRYSPDKVRAAVRNGLRPDGAMAGLAAAFGQDLNSGWVQMVMRDTTDWALCSSCAVRLESFLGPTLKTRTFTGKTEEEARAAADASDIPGDKVTEVKVTRGVREETVKAEGSDAEAAQKAARARIPSAAFDVGEPQVLATGEKGAVEIEAQLESDARSDWKPKAPAGAILDACECLVPPKAGFIGIGRKPGLWKISWYTPFRAQVSYKLPVEVTVTYKG